MPVYYRGPDRRRPEVVITDRLVRVRLPGGWRVWSITGMRDLGVVHTGPGAGRAMWALGTSALLVGSVAFRLRGWSLIAAGAVFALAVVFSFLDLRHARARACSQLWATYRDTPVVVFELPERHFAAACRGLVRALDHLEDTQ